MKLLTTLLSLTFGAYIFVTKLGTSTALSNVPSSHYLRGPFRKLQGTVPTLSFCPSTIGSDAGLWADLLNVNDPENYQAVFLLSLDNGSTYLDRSMPSDLVTMNQPNYVPLEWGYAGFLYIDSWVYRPNDINATHFALFALPLNVSLTNLRLSTTIGQPLPNALANQAIAYGIAERTEQLPQCAIDLLEGELPQCTECTDDTENNNNNGDGTDAEIRAKSGSFRNTVVTRSFGVFLASFLGCLTLKR